MKQTKNNWKTLVLSMGLAAMMLSPISTNAQTDRSGGLFGTTSEADEVGLMNRSGEPVGVLGSVSNYGIGEEVPLGSGVVIMLLAGAGYAALRRKRSRKGMALLLACVLTLGFTQCKKEQPVEPTQNAGVHITLKMEGGASTQGDGSKVAVNPTGAETYATVDFEDGDVIYVGNDGAYVGYLTYDRTQQAFSGDINPTSTDDYLHFYLLGGKGFTPTISGNTATVNISNQSAKYPVVSYAPSTKKYTSGLTSYTAKLLNKVSIMKFNVTTAVASKSCVCIDGMNNTVTVDFTDPNGTTNGFSYSKSDNGQLMMPGGNGTQTSFTTWAIVLPQDEDLPEAEGKVYVNGYKGTRPVIAAMGSNQYLSDGVDLTINTLTNQLIGVFAVGSTKQVHFSKGNLQATTTDLGANWTWSFAPNQYTWIGNTIANTAITGKGTVSENGTVDLFGYSTDNTNNFFGIIKSKRDNYYPDGPTRGPFLDWGTNSIGGSAANYWYTMEKSKWEYLLYTRATPRFAKANVNGVYGLLVFPDNFSWNTTTMGAVPSTIDNTSGNYNSTNCDISSEHWAMLEAVGVVFLPGTGYRPQNENYVSNINPARGYYWFCDTNGTQSGSGTTYDNNSTYYLYFGQGNLFATTYTMSKRSGAAVRLVHDVE